MYNMIYRILRTNTVTNMSYGYDIDLEKIKVSQTDN